MIVSLLLILLGDIKMRGGGMLLRWHVAQIGEFRYTCKHSSAGQSGDRTGGGRDF